MSNSVSLSSSVWLSLSLRSLAELISWDSPLKLSPPLSSSSGRRLWCNIACICQNKSFHICSVWVLLWTMQLTSVSPMLWPKEKAEENELKQVSPGFVHILHQDRLSFYQIDRGMADLYSCFIVWYQHGDSCGSWRCVDPPGFHTRGLQQLLCLSYIL